MKYCFFERLNALLQASTVLFVSLFSFPTSSQSPSALDPDMLWNSLELFLSGAGSMGQL